MILNCSNIGVTGSNPTQDMNVVRVPLWWADPASKDMYNTSKIIHSSRTQNKPRGLNHCS